MKNRTVKVIVILISLLFLNIEAAHAGLISKIKVFIYSEFPDNEFYYLLGGLIPLSLFAYGVFAPVIIGKEKWSWINYNFEKSGPDNYQSRRKTVKKIAEILTDSRANPRAQEQA